MAHLEISIWMLEPHIQDVITDLKFQKIYFTIIIHFENFYKKGKYVKSPAGFELMTCRSVSEAQTLRC